MWIFGGLNTKKDSTSWNQWKIEHYTPQFGFWKTAKPSTYEYCLNYGSRDVLQLDT
jgi:hypothetical protein